jgi:hypothetical protein
MHIEDFIRRLDGISNVDKKFSYSIDTDIRFDIVDSTALRLQINIPEKIKLFYLFLNNLKTRNPDFEIIGIEKWVLENGFIDFAIFDSLKIVSFDTRQLNEAGEWDIVNRSIDYELTKTISSFWSNKIWKWLEWRRPIWAPDWLE